MAGQCFQTSSSSPSSSMGRYNTPPNGLQLTLLSSSSSSSSSRRRPLHSHSHQQQQQHPVDNDDDVVPTGGSIVSDTLVMQNLGYFQLQAASPGLFALHLAQGRASDLFDLKGKVTTRRLPPTLPCIMKCTYCRSGLFRGHPYRCTYFRRHYLPYHR